MKDSRCWREVLIRGGMTAVIMAVATIFLRVDPWVWLIVPAIVALTIIKWSVRPADLDGGEDEDVADLL